MATFIINTANILILLLRNKHMFKGHFPVEFTGMYDRNEFLN